MHQRYLSAHVGDLQEGSQVWRRSQTREAGARPARGDVQSDTTDNPVTTVTVDLQLGAGDCLLDCGPVLLNFGSLHDQIYGV